jgi:hypothetical protein
MFDDEQISELEDRITNKIIFPLKMIEKISHSYSVTSEQLMLAKQNLQDLLNWVKSLR